MRYITCWSNGEQYRVLYSDGDNDDGDTEGDRSDRNNFSSFSQEARSIKTPVINMLR